jgi:hypothetical protein
MLAADTVAGHYDTYFHKVGRTTGWSFGPQTRTCYIYYVAGKALVCQYSVAAEADQGDSGSPVFMWICCNVNEAWIGGLLSSATEGLAFGFSSISGVKNDFANLVTH